MGTPKIFVKTRDMYQVAEDGHGNCWVETEKSGGFSVEYLLAVDAEKREAELVKALEIIRDDVGKQIALTVTHAAEMKRVLDDETREDFHDSAQTHLMEDELLLPSLRWWYKKANEALRTAPK